ncbi:FIST signal transduction protein [Hydrogenimonas sp.]
MEVRQYRFEESWNEPFDTALDSPQTLVLMFGEMGRSEKIDRAIEEVCEAFPRSVKAGCSSAGEIYDGELFEHSLVVSVACFEKSRLKKAVRTIASPDDSEQIGRELAESLSGEGLKAVLLISEGLVINGTELTRGVNEALPSDVVVTGGLAGDDSRFEITYVLDDENRPRSGVVSAVGFYGGDFRVASGYRGGWDRFGVERKITAAKKNVLYTLNDEPALEVYKRYLGRYASELPASALLFPLAVRESKETRETKVRTVLAVDEETQSITFAGDIPEGGYATFMKSNFDRLIDGVYDIAETIARNERIAPEALCVAISCVGRKLLLRQRTEEELEAILEVLPPGVRQIGFYSYGEISPMRTTGACDLHNQTMTLSLYWEV